MREYLKRAFWAGPTLPGLGRLPLNALAMAGLAILGFGHPAFWLLGAGLEAGYLALVSSHPRFQRRVDAERRRAEESLAAEERQGLVARLDGEGRQRLARIQLKCEEIVRLARTSHATAFEIENQRDALDRLAWIYLRLLLSRAQLQTARGNVLESDLRRRIDELERELAGGEGSAPLRESRAVTLRLLRQRRDNLGGFEQTAQQLDSDLGRIEAQVDLTLESAGLGESGAGVTANLELAERILESQKAGLLFASSGTIFEESDEIPSPAPLPLSEGAPRPAERR
jgi:hypothetical protein